jgi:prepilin-type N-terminal cleavage/methylation domain-containing protein
MYHSRNGFPAQRSKGLTLIELLIAVSILGIIMVFGLASYHYALRQVAAVRAREAALRLVQEPIEKAKAMYFADIPLTLQVETITDDLTGRQFTRYSGAMYVTGGDRAGIPAQEYKIIVSSITWNVNSSTQTMEMRTLVVSNRQTTVKD